MQFTYPHGATPLDPDETAALLLPITTQDALNEAEYQAILTTRIVYGRKRLVLKDLLSIGGLLRLHKEMFADVWGWAGTFRATEKNIGVAPHQIQVQLQVLLDNILFRLSLDKNENAFELLAHFHHQLVWIHPFVNGNGRHSRFATEILARVIQTNTPKWANEKKLIVEGPERTKYIDALRSADKGDLNPLVTLMYL